MRHWRPVTSTYTHGHLPSTMNAEFKYFSKHDMVQAFTYIHLQIGLFSLGGTLSSNSYLRSRTPPTRSTKCSRYTQLATESQTLCHQTCSLSFLTTSFVLFLDFLRVAIAETPTFSAAIIHPMASGLAC